MRKMKIIKILFILYIILIIAFNLSTLPYVALPGFEILVSLFWIIILLLLIFNISSRKKVIWWGFFLVSLLGILRPAFEYIFSITVPLAAQSFFPIFTPIFGTFGFIIMLISFIVLLDMKIKKKFNKL